MAPTGCSGWEGRPTETRTLVAIYLNYAITMKCDVTHLFGEDEHDPFEHLIPAQTGQRQKEEKSIEHRFGNVLEGRGEEEEGETDENVSSDWCHASFSHVHDSARKRHNNSIFTPL